MHKFTRQPFEFQQKMGEILEDLPNGFGKADDMLIVGYDANHDRTLRNVMQIFCQEYLK